MSAPGRTSFVGRAGVLGALDELLDDARGGAGSAALLYGEAGIGKTRTLQEIARTAAAAGFLVAWGHCTELDGVPPYWPWRGVFDALGVGAPDVSGGRATVLSTLVDRLDAVAREQPVLLFVEDLHWADADTRWLLRGAVDATAGRPVCVLGTWRSAETAEEISDLPPRVHRIPLGPLTLDEVAEVARETGGALSDDAVERAARQSGGNPFFAREIVRMQVVGAPGSERVPRGIRDVLSRRLARLHTDTVEALTAVAVLGPDAELRVLARTVGCPLDAVVELLEPAVRAGLVEPLDQAGPVQFVHGVVREVLLGTAGVRRTAALHEQAALALERLRPERDEPLARHWAAVPGDAGRERAVRYARRARDRAREAAALDQAVAFAELVVARTDDPADRVVLGDLRARSGDVAGARRELLPAAAAARAAGRDDLLARAALALAAGEGGFEIALNDPEQVDLLTEAAGRLPPGALRARVLARLAVAAAVSATIEERLGTARAALAEAEDSADDAALLHALAAYADMIGGPAHVAERRAVADRMLALARQVGDVNGELLARRFRLVALLEVGDFPAADVEIAAFDRLARRTHEPSHLWYPPLWRGMRALLAGREADAEAFAEEAAAIGARAQSLNALMLVTTLRCAVRWQRPEDLADVVRRVEGYATDFPPDLPQLLVAQASVFARTGDREATERCYRPLADVGFRSVPEDAEFLSGLLGAVEAAVLLRDDVGAAALYALLEPFADVWIVDGIGAACWGLTAQWLAPLAELLGRHADADRLRTRAAVAYRATGATGPLQRLNGSDPPPTAGRGRLQRGADGWSIGWDGQQTTLPELKGLHDLATLLTSPGVPVPATRLVAVSAGVDLGPPAGGDEVLDERARAAYRDRLRTLEDQIAEATADADLGRAERLRDERAFLLRELSAALGLGGRARRLGDDADRARKAVTMRLRDVIGRLDEPLPALARHLRAALRTGRTCAYDPPEPVSWQVRTVPPAG
jgi:hypothetical protein